MPQRKNLLRQQTWAQGDDSWVEYEPFTVGDRFDPERKTTTREEVMARVKKWNWVDKAGNELPQPEDEPGIFNTLSTYEMSCLIDVVYGFPNETDVKN